MPLDPKHVRRRCNCDIQNRNWLGPGPRSASYYDRGATLKIEVSFPSLL